MERRYINKFMTKYCLSFICIAIVLSLISCDNVLDGSYNDDVSMNSEAASSETQANETELLKNIMHTDWHIKPIEILSKELEIEIISRYLEDVPAEEGISVEDISLRFYGTYGDAYVMFIDNPYLEHMEILCQDDIGDYSFRYTNSQTLVVYYNGDFFSLPQASEKGIIEDDDIWELYKRYVGEDIKNQYVKNVLVSKDNYTTQDIKIRAYGGFFTERQYNTDMWFIFVDVNDILYDNVATIEKVCGYEFKYPTSQQLLIYYEYQFYTVSDAYSNGYIDNNAVKFVYEAYMSNINK